MLFTSGQFLFVFLPIVAAAFFLIAKLAGSRLAASTLVVASLYFYGFWRPEYVVLLLASIALNYLFGSLLQNTPAQSPKGKALLAVAVAVNLLALSYYKYADFLSGTAN